MPNPVIIPLSAGNQARLAKALRKIQKATNQQSLIIGSILDTTPNVPIGYTISLQPTMIVLLPPAEGLPAPASGPHLVANDAITDSAQPVTE